MTARSTTTGHTWRAPSAPSEATGLVWPACAGTSRSFPRSSWVRMADTPPMQWPRSTIWWTSKTGTTSTWWPRAIHGAAAATATPCTAQSSALRRPISCSSRPPATPAVTTTRSVPTRVTTVRWFPRRPKRRHRTSPSSPWPRSHPRVRCRISRATEPPPSTSGLRGPGSSAPFRITPTRTSAVPRWPHRT